MDGAPIRQSTLRIHHDCPVANLSLENPRWEIDVWSGHRVEVVSVRAPSGDPTEAIRAHLDPLRIVPVEGGVIAVWRPHVEPKASLSRRIEKHGLVWLQPLHVRDGWERYDVLSFTDEAEQAAIDDLRRDHEIRVGGRRNVGPDEVAASLFRSLQPVIQAPSTAQVEALVRAYEQGYYRSPRGTTTAKVAGSMGIGRSAFEERLRRAENHIMANLVPAFRQDRPF